jgi:hypothetical protein
MGIAAQLDFYAHAFRGIHRSLALVVVIYLGKDAFTGVAIETTRSSWAIGASSQPPLRHRLLWRFWPG